MADLNPGHLRGRAIVDIAVVEGDVVRGPRLAGRVDKVELEEPEADRLHVVDAGENLDAVDGVVVVLVVEQDLLLDDNLLLGIADVNEAKVVVWDGNPLDWIKS